MRCWNYPLISKNFRPCTALVKVAASRSRYKSEIELTESKYLLFLILNHKDLEYYKKLVKFSRPGRLRSVTTPWLLFLPHL